MNNFRSEIETCVTPVNDTLNVSVLVVEDDPVDRQYLERQLENTDLTLCHTGYVQSLTEAFDVMRDRSFDIVLLDLNLPDCRGAASCRKLMREFPDTLIIAVTGEGDERLGLETITQGALEYLVKGTFSARILSNTIRFALERKRQQQALRQERDFAESLIETTQAIVLLLDPQGKIVRFNPYMEQLSGYALEEVQGKDWFETFLPQDVISHIQNAFSETIARTQTTGVVNPIVTKHGESRLIEWHNKTLMDDFGNVVCVLATGHDITDRIQVEDSLMAANEQLRRANEQLQDVHKQVVQNEKLACIGQLAAGVAHEMNTPMGFVGGNFETLQRHVEKMTTMLRAYDRLADALVSLNINQPEVTRQLESIRKLRQTSKVDFVLDDIDSLFTESQEGVRHVTNIIRNLRDFSRSDNGGEFVEHSLNDGIQATLLVAHNEIKYDADIELDLGELSPIQCNPGQINQVILNILVNAAQAIKTQAREDKGTISIRTYMEGSFAVCRIADNGPGMPEDVKAKIFNAFFTTKPKGKGTGLGLSVSHDIVVNTHQGLLSVDSTPGQGAVFTIKLPVIRPGQPSEE